jgi:hypothetical protein
VGLISGMGGFESTPTTTNFDSKIGGSTSQNVGMFEGVSPGAGLDQTCWLIGVLAFGTVAVITAL